MMCRLCTWLCDRFCAPGVNSSELWRAIHDWEEDFASDWEPAEDGLRERWKEAEGLKAENPAAALAIYRELAEGGSAYSLLMAGCLYERGRGTEKEVAIAEEFYRRALCAGSWKATLRYADLLFKRGAREDGSSTLGDGVTKGFIPSFFWLAWYHYKHSPSRKTAREVRFLLEHAAEAGHPGARTMLARLTSLGKFGLREIPRGIRMVGALVQSLIESESGDATAVKPAPAVRVVWKGGRL